MKKGEKAEFSQSWWKGSQPKDAKKQPALQSAGRLELALKAYENAFARLERDTDEEALKNVESQLDNVETCAKAVVTEAGRDKKNPDMEATAQCLGKMDFAGERKRAAALVEDEAGALTDPKLFIAKLRRGLQKLERRSNDAALDPDKRGMNFGFVPGKTAIGHRLLLHPTQAGRALATHAATDLNVEQRLVTFGFASADPEKSDRIRLQLEGKKIPGLAKKVRLMLKAFRSAQFKTAVLFEGGVEVADELDPADEDDVAELGAEEAPAAPDWAAMKAELTSLVEQIKKLPGGVGAQQALVPLVAAITGGLRAQDDAASTLANLSSLREAVAAAASGPAAAARPASGAAAANGAAPAGSIPTPPPPPPGTPLERSQRAWAMTRERIRTDLAKLRDALRTAYEGQAVAAEIDSAYQARSAPVLATLDERLSAKIAEVAATTDPAAQMARANEARAIIAEYEKFVAENAFLAAVDTNPFVPVTAAKSTRDALAAMAKTLPAAA